MNKRAGKPSASKGTSCKGRGKKTCPRLTAKSKRTGTEGVTAGLTPELLALISNPSALMRCSRTCPWYAACDHAQSYSGKLCPVEGNRYAETVAWWVRYCLARRASVNFLVLRSIADIAALTVQIERAERYTVERGFFYEQRKEREGSDMVRLQIQPIVDQINRLYERRRRDIRDIETYLTQTAGKQRSQDEQEGLTLAQKMAEFVQKAKPLLYASLAAGDGKTMSLEDWTYPGDTPEEAERCRREAQRILAMIQKKGAA